MATSICRSMSLQSSTPRRFFMKSSQRIRRSGFRACVCRSVLSMMIAKASTNTWGAAKLTFVEWIRRYCVLPCLETWAWTWLLDCTSRTCRWKLAWAAQFFEPRQAFWRSFETFWAQHPPPDPTSQARCTTSRGPPYWIHSGSCRGTRRSSGAKGLSAKWETWRRQRAYFQENLQIFVNQLSRNSRCFCALTIFHQEFNSFFGFLVKQVQSYAIITLSYNLTWYFKVFRRDVFLRKLIRLIIVVYVLALPQRRRSTVHKSFVVKFLNRDAALTSRRLNGLKASVSG